jgi:hypothetical protein
MRYYSSESQVVHLGPSLNSNSKTKPLVTNFSWGRDVARGFRRREAMPSSRKWWGSKRRPARIREWPRLITRWPEEAGPCGAMAHWRRLGWPQGFGGFRLGQECARGGGRRGGRHGAHSWVRGGLWERDGGGGRSFATASMEAPFFAAQSEGKVWLMIYISIHLIVQFKHLVKPFQPGYNLSFHVTL